jgi:hypothetical protein
MTTTTTDVFGIRTKPVLSYVSRPSVDGRFEGATRTDHHIVVYGSSKQGKTALRQTHIRDDRCAVYRCSPKSTTEQIYQSVLRSAGIKIQVTQTTTVEGEVGVKTKAGFSAFLPFVGKAKAEIEGDVRGSASHEVESEFIGYDLGDAQAVAEILVKAGFDKYVVLENFHYLNGDVQRALAFDLKTFHEVGVRFVILGIWQESNLLMTHNGDLQDRIVEVPVEPWSSADFDAIVGKGSELLNVVIDRAIVVAFENESYGNVGLFQEFLREYCLQCGLSERSATFERLSRTDARDIAIQSKLESQRAVLLKALQGIAARSRVRHGEEALLLPYYLVQVILASSIDDLRRGLEKGRLLELLRAIHHRSEKDTIRTGDVTNLLVKLPSYQRDISPPLLHYDSNAKRLRIVDSRTFFVLSRVEREELADDIPRPDVTDDELFDHDGAGESNHEETDKKDL